MELSTRFPEEGGFTSCPKRPLEIFTASWPGGRIGFILDLLFSSASAGQRRDGCLHRRGRDGAPGGNRAFLLSVSFALLFVAVFLNIIGLNIGKWLQNAGGLGAAFRFIILVGVAVMLWRMHGPRHISRLPRCCRIGTGHGKFLAAVSVCLYGIGTGFGHERRDQGPAAHHAARHSRLRRGHCRNLYRRDVRGAGDSAGRTGRS